MANLKPNTLKHLEAAKANRKHKPSDFLKMLASHKGDSGKPARSLVRKQVKSRKAIADKLRGYRKENPSLARLWHRT